MLSERDLSAAIGSTAHGPDGEKIGTVESFFVDDRTGAPTWVAVSTGLFGTRHSVVPATEATFTDGMLQVPVGKEAVRHAPAVHGDHLSPEEEADLRRHYGIGTGTGTGIGTGTEAGAGTGVPTGTTTGTTTDRTTGTADTTAQAPAQGVAGTAPASGASAEAAGLVPGPATDPGTRPVPPPASDVRTTTEQAAPPVPQHSDGAMTRSEEQVRVGTEQVAATRVRVVKYVVTEEVQVTVPIRREEIRIEEVPFDAPDPGPGESLVPGGAGTGGGVTGGATGGGVAGGVGSEVGSGGQVGVGLAGVPDEIVLHAERPVVTVEVVPVERVRLRTELVQGHERITEQVQREQIVVDETPARHAGTAPAGTAQTGTAQTGTAEAGPAPADRTQQIGAVPPADRTQQISPVPQAGQAPPR
ncbi:PRC-barrel domain-containing protein [Geodermatophilus nigrescens]|uniref:Conserved domain-containing protein n=1 Tax=Geodermatophilus nigrescens TaxID=1070870 RepID=A0A1M5Q2Z2_9ACTN|nr:PRC-barrel domain-containing protein [Geodermatophilus nigrescens]SHH08647.1 conserved domain-containing protein [Geodermatophilus nigrescens]